MAQLETAHYEGQSVCGLLVAGGLAVLVLPMAFFRGRADAVS